MAARTSTISHSGSRRRGAHAARPQAQPAVGRRRAVQPHPHGPLTVARPHRVRYSPAAKKTLQLALREALHLGHHHIGTEHILLGLLRTDDDPAARLLIGAGVTLKAAGEWLRTAAED